MKRHLMILIGKMTAVAAIAIVLNATSFGQEGKSGEDAKGGRLVGTWDAVVTIRDCNTGAPLNTFPSIASFNQGGTSIGSTSGLPQANRTPEHGIWRHLRGNRFEFSFKSFNFVGGVAATYTIVTHDLYLNKDGDTYISEGTAKIYNLADIQVGLGCSDAVGTRFEF